ncbi:hypothetical protein [Tepidibacillus marianensis]|uniref:hypothetical protein n=1 Tax=Tepidibacillus marianensis TaxID=3131995 RepID=UPI0030D20F0B
MMKNERELTRAKYNLAKEDIVIAYIGKFDYMKRPDLIFEIIDIFDEKYISLNNTNLSFIGPKDKEYINYFNQKMKCERRSTTSCIRTYPDSKAALELLISRFEFQGE